MSETRDETRKLTIIFEYGDRRETLEFDDSSNFEFQHDEKHGEWIYDEQPPRTVQGPVTHTDIVISCDGAPKITREDR